MATTPPRNFAPPRFKTPGPQLAPATTAPAAPQESAEPKAHVNAYGVTTEHRKTIDGCLYTTTLYPAKEGFNHLLFLSQAAASPLSLVLSGLGNLASGGAGELPSRDLGQAVFDLVHVVQAAGGADKILELLAYTQVKQSTGAWVRVADDYDAWGQGRPAHVAKVLAWVVEVNLLPFGRGPIGSLQSRLTALLEGLQAKSTEPPASSP